MAATGMTMPSPQRLPRPSSVSVSAPTRLLYNTLDLLYSLLGVLCAIAVIALPLVGVALVLMAVSGVSSETVSAAIAHAIAEKRTPLIHASMQAACAVVETAFALIATGTLVVAFARILGMASLASGRALLSRHERPMRTQTRSTRSTPEAITSLLPRSSPRSDATLPSPEKADERRRTRDDDDEEQSIKSADVNAPPRPVVQLPDPSPPRTPAPAATPAPPSHDPFSTFRAIEPSALMNSLTTFLILAVYLLVSVTLMMALEPTWTAIDASYFAMMTMSTVGCIYTTPLLCLSPLPLLCLSPLPLSFYLEHWPWLAV